MSQQNHDGEPVERTRAYAEHRNTDVQNVPGDDTDTWLVGLLDKRVRPSVDTGDSRLYIHCPYTGPNEPNRYRLRLRHPDTGESDISPALDAGEFESYLFGLIHGLTGEIEHHAHGTADN